MSSMFRKMRGGAPPSVEEALFFLTGEQVKVFGKIDPTDNEAKGELALNKKYERAHQIPDAGADDVHYEYVQFLCELALALNEVTKVGTNLSNAKITKFLDDTFKHDADLFNFLNKILCIECGGTDATDGAGTPKIIVNKNTKVDLDTDISGVATAEMVNLKLSLITNAGHVRAPAAKKIAGLSSRGGYQSGGAPPALVIGNYIYAPSATAKVCTQLGVAPIAAPVDLPLLIEAVATTGRQALLDVLIATLTHGPMTLHVATISHLLGYFNSAITVPVRAAWSRNAELMAAFAGPVTHGAPAGPVGSSKDCPLTDYTNRQCKAITETCISLDPTTFQATCDSLLDHTLDTVKLSAQDIINEVRRMDVRLAVQILSKF